MLLTSSYATAAGDLAAGFYISMSLGKGESYYGLQASFDASRDADVLPDVVGQPRRPETGLAVFDWRNAFSGGQEILLNGIRLSSDPRLYTDGDDSKKNGESQFDIQVVAAVVVGAALVAAIANADSVKGCVGTACPSPDPPDPPESSEPAASD